MSNDRHRAARICALLREQRQTALQVQNKAGDVARVLLYDEIGAWGITASDFAAALDGVTAGTIELHLNSPGGDYFDGIAILNSLRQHPARVVAVVDGLAASAASFIAVGADETVMAPNSELMLHDAFGLVVGNAADMRDMADRLDQLSDNIAAIYAGKAGGTVADWRAVLRAETWYSAEEAVTAGLADRLDDSPGGEQPTARFDLSIFAYAGRANAPAPPIPSEGSPLVPTDATLAALRQRLGVTSDADEPTILAALDEVLEELADPPHADHTVLPPQIRAQLDELEQLKNERFTARLNTALTDAMKAGKITPAERGGWTDRYQVAPEETLQALAALPANRSGLPLVPIGSDRNPEMAPADQFYNALFPDEAGAR